MESPAKVGLACVVGLVVVLAAGTTIWRRSHTRREVDRPNAALTLRPTMGSLLLTPTMKNGSNTSAYWVYINQHIVAVKPDPAEDRESLSPMSFNLFPKDYTVEIATMVPDEKTNDFPIVFSSYYVSVEPGQTTSISVAIGVPISQGARTTTGMTEQDASVEYLKELFGSVNKRLEEYRADPAALAVQDAYIALAQSPPVTAVVYINMPDEYGGGREYDPVQVRAIVSWLDFKFWGWFDAAAFRSEPSRIPEALRPQFDELASQVQQLRLSIRNYNRIAEKLEQAKKARENMP